VILLSTTASLQYNIWRGLYVRGEYRHDHGDEKVFGCRPSLGGSENASQDTVSRSASYRLF
jgi:hypothetical protein